jgi:hypothetical protein
MCFSLYDEVSNNYSLTIKLPSNPFVCIITSSINPEKVNLLGITLAFRSIIMFLIVNIINKLN